MPTPARLPRPDETITWVPKHRVAKATKPATPVDRSELRDLLAALRAIYSDDPEAFADARAELMAGIEPPRRQSTSLRRRYGS